MTMDPPPARCVLHTLLVLVLLDPGSAAPCPRPCSCPQPAELHCTFRSLLTIPAALPRHVERMNLGFNSIQQLTDGSLAGLRRLELLMVHGNDIHSLPDGAFRDLSSLQMLKMSYNKLQEISRLSLQGLWSLTRLHLDHNRLRFIHPDSFQGLTSLRLLQLEGNRLQQLHPSTFSTFTVMGVFHISTLRHLHLSDNGLTSLPSGLLEAMPQLENLYLHGNPWTCDCSMSWFQDWNKASPGVLKCKKDRSLPGGQLCASCSSPRHLLMKELQEVEDLVCSGPVISSPHRPDPPPEDADTELLTLQHFRAPLGNVSLGLSDEHGTEVEVECSVGEPRAPRRSWEQVGPGQLLANISVSVDLQCPVDRQKYERLWRLVAYYSSVPAHLQRGAVLGAEPQLTYVYRQDSERDARYYTGVTATLRARPAWLMQPSAELQLNRLQSSASAVQLVLSTALTETLDTELQRRQTRTWVLIRSNNTTHTLLTAMLGAPAHMHCPVHSSGHAVVHWKLPDGSRMDVPREDVPSSRQGSRVSVSSDGRLLVKAASHSDSGVYYCIAAVSRDLSVLAVHLSVQESSSPPPGEETPAPPVEGHAGDPVSLPCAASGVPDAQISWILPSGSVVSVHTNSSRASVSSNGTLLLRQTQRTDSGFYKCVAINQHGVDTLATQVSVVRRRGLVRPLRRFPSRPQSASGVNTQISIPTGDTEDTEDASGDSDVPQEEAPLRRRLPGGVAPGRRGLHQSRNMWRRPALLRRPTGPHVEDRRRTNVSKSKIDPERWADILAKIRHRTAHSTVTPAPGRITPEETREETTTEETREETTTEETTEETREETTTEETREETREETTTEETREETREETTTEETREETTTEETTEETREETTTEETTEETREETTTEETREETREETTREETTTEETTEETTTEETKEETKEETREETREETTTEETREETTTEGTREETTTEETREETTTEETREETTTEETREETTTEEMTTDETREETREETTTEETREETTEETTTEEMTTEETREEMTTEETREETTTEETTTEETTTEETSEETTTEETTEETATEEMREETKEETREETTTEETREETVEGSSEGGTQQEYTTTHTPVQYTQTNTPTAQDTQSHNIHATTHRVFFLLRSTSGPVHTGSTSSLQQNQNTVQNQAADWSRASERREPSDRLNVSSSHHDREDFWSPIIPKESEPSQEETGTYQSATAAEPLLDSILQALKPEATLPTAPPRTTSPPPIRHTDSRRRSGGRRRRPNRRKQKLNKPTTLADGLLATVRSPASTQVKIDPVEVPVSGSRLGHRESSDVSRPDPAPSSPPAPPRSESMSEPASSPNTTPHTTLQLSESGPPSSSTGPPPAGPAEDTQSPTGDIRPVSHSQTPTDGHRSIRPSSEPDIRTISGSSNKLLKDEETNTPSVSRTSDRTPGQTLNMGGDVEAPPTSTVQSAALSAASSGPLPESSSTGATLTPVTVQSQDRQIRPIRTTSEPKTTPNVQSATQPTSPAVPGMTGTGSPMLTQTPSPAPVRSDASSHTLPTTTQDVSRQHRPPGPDPPPRGKPRITQRNFQTVTVTTGTDAQLPCEAEGEPLPFLSWTAAGGTYDSTHSSSGGSAQNTRVQRFEVHPNGTLIIRKTQLGDRGQYLCRVQNRYGSAQTVVNLLVLSRRPSLRDVTVPLGGTADLECNVEGQPASLVTWILPNMVHMTAASVGVSSLQRVVVLSNGTLRVHRAGYTDRGLYECSGEDSVSVHLYVLALPPVIHQTPHENSTLPEGSSASIHCSASGAPPPVIRWTAPDGVQLTASQLVTGRNLVVFPNGTLHIRGLGPGHAGRYECSASNAVASSRRTVTLNIRRSLSSSRARITSSSPQRTDVTYGSKLLLNCVAAGDPAPRVIWRTPSNKLVDAQYSFEPRIKVFSNGSLTVLSVTDEDSGDFLCVARNRMGDDYVPLRVNVLTRPAKIEQKQQRSRQEVVYGGDLKVDCVASGLPDPEISWALPDGTMVNPVKQRDGTSGGRSRRYVVFDNGTLYFNDVGVPEEGDYTCYAQNQLGKDEMKVRVKVKAATAAPQIQHKDQKTVRVFYGETVTLRCLARGDPVPKVSWMSPTNRLISPALDKYQVLDDGTLVVQKVQRFDGGNYTCTARSAAGQDHKVTRLEVLVTPPTINGFTGTANAVKVTAVPDQRRLLDCVAKGTPPPRVMWVLPENVILPAPYHSSRMSVHPNGTLDIHSARRADSGQLACIARNEGGEVRLLVNLLVETPRTDRRSLTVGNAMTLNCSFDGSPLRHVTWILPSGAPLLSGTRSSKFFHRTNGSLVISNPSVAEAGVYRCLGRHSAGLLERSITLFPGRKPDITSRYSSPVRIMNGETLLLHCQTSAEPFKLSWTLPSAVVLNRPQRAGRYAVLPNGTLAIQQVSVYDRGPYACRAANEYGSALLSVSVIVTAFPPQITSGPPSVTYAKRGVAVQLNCVATGVPKVEVAWETPDKTRLAVSTLPRLFRNKYLHPQGSLVIQNPTHQDSGVYRCTARNAIGSDFKDTFLNVF
ncbi:matrix-remodeling-associated protein 5 [Embiotoca jacksoni]|uniref:matrix-remodeling-associated protein 5 n=1 Tax=Embiotoca jacksoni TaxID=100190 RepID=UPI00370493D7